MFLFGGSVMANQIAATVRMSLRRARRAPVRLVGSSVWTGTAPILVSCVTDTQTVVTAQMRTPPSAVSPAPQFE